MKEESISFEAGIPVSENTELQEEAVADANTSQENDSDSLAEKVPTPPIK